MNNENAYYPLSIGNNWTYDGNTAQAKDEQGVVYDAKININVEGCDPAGNFMISNPYVTYKVAIKKVNDDYFSDNLEQGNMLLFLKDNLKPGDSWEVKYKGAGGMIDTITVYNVKEVLANKEVNGVDYKDVVMIESENKYVVAGNAVSMNMFTQTYYAKGIGQILTTTGGAYNLASSTPLLSHQLK